MLDRRNRCQAAVLNVAYESDIQNVTGTIMILREIGNDWKEEIGFVNLYPLYDQHWFRKLLGVVRHQAITWAKANWDMCRNMAPQGPIISKTRQLILFGNVSASNDDQSFQVSWEWRAFEVYVIFTTLCTAKLRQFCARLLYTLCQTRPVLLVGLYGGKICMVARALYILIYKH